MELDSQHPRHFLPHHACVRVDAGPVFDAGDALVDEHAEAVDRSGACGFGVAHQPGAGRVDDDVGDHEALAQA